MQCVRIRQTYEPDNTYIPIRCGHLSSSVRTILENLDIDIPKYKRDVFPKVGDVLMNSDYRIDADDELTVVAAIYEKNNPSAIPVYDKDEFFGLLTVDDITNWTMRELAKDNKITKIPKVRHIMTEQAPPVDRHELFEDARTLLQNSAKRGLAVYDDNEYIGYVTRRCFLKCPKNNVILVDHNEPRQSIQGIETANIIGIVDHHRLDAIKTDQPIFIDAEPLGSTCTIVYQQYIRNNRGVNLEQYGLEMFTLVEGLKKRDPESAISSDFKIYTEKGIRIGIGQCEVTQLNDLNDYSDAYAEGLDLVKTKNGLDWAVLMITDVIHEHSALICTKHKATRHLPYKSTGPYLYDMPGVMSRKKQLLPEILHAISE